MSADAPLRAASASATSARPPSIPPEAWRAAVVALVDAPGWSPPLDGAPVGWVRAARIGRAVAHLLDVAAGRRPTGCCPRPIGCPAPVDALFGRYDRGEWRRANRPRPLRCEPSPEPAGLRDRARCEAAERIVGDLGAAVERGAGREWVGGELRRLIDVLEGA